LKNRKLTIATCQFDVCGDVHRNLSVILHQILKAKSKKADIVHFPECSLTGYGGIELPEIHAEDYPHLLPALNKVQLAARQYGIYVILGAHHFDKHLDKPRNSLYVINVQGQIVARYDKRILTGTDGTMDHLYYSPGKDPVIFQLNGINCGLLICHEWRYPELYREYKKSGVELVFHSWYDGGLDINTFKSEGKYEGELILGSIKGYAANNYLWVSGSNTSKKESCFPGFIVQPNGMILNKGHRNRQEVRITEIDFDQQFDDPSFYGRKRFL